MGGVNPFENIEQPKDQVVDAAEETTGSSGIDLASLTNTSDSPEETSLLAGTGLDTSSSVVTDISATAAPGAVVKPATETKLTAASLSLSRSSAGPTLGESSLNSLRSSAPAKQVNDDSYGEGLIKGIYEEAVTNTITGVATILHGGPAQTAENQTMNDSSAFGNVVGTGWDLGVMGGKVLVTDRVGLTDNSTTAALGQTWNQFKAQTVSDNDGERGRAHGRVLGFAGMLMVGVPAAARGTTGLVDDLARARTIAGRTGNAADNLIGVTDNVTGATVGLTDNVVGLTDNVGAAGSRVPPTTVITEAGNQSNLLGGLIQRGKNFGTAVSDNYAQLRNRAGTVLDNVGDNILPQRQPAFAPAGGSPPVRFGPSLRTTVTDIGRNPANQFGSQGTGWLGFGRNTTRQATGLADNGTGVLDNVAGQGDGLAPVLDDVGGQLDNVVSTTDNGGGVVARASDDADALTTIGRQGDTGSPIVKAGQEVTETGSGVTRVTPEELVVNPSNATDNLVANAGDNLVPPSTKPVSTARVTEPIGRGGNSIGRTTGRELVEQAESAITSASDNLVASTDNLSNSVDELIAKAGGETAPQAIRELDELVKQAVRDPSDLTRAQAVQDALRTLPKRLADDGIDVTSFSDELAAVSDTGANFTSATRNLGTAQAQRTVANATDNMAGASDDLSASVDELVVKSGGDAAPLAIRELDELVKQVSRDPSDLTRAQAVQDALRSLPQRLADDGVDVTRLSDELAAVSDNGANFTRAADNLSLAEVQRAVVNATDNMVGATDNLSASVDELVVKAGGDAAPQAIRELDQLVKQAVRDPSDLTRANAVQDALRSLPQRLADDGVDVTRFSDELAGVSDNGANFASATRNLGSAQARSAVATATDSMAGAIDNLSSNVDELVVKAGGDAAPQAIRELDELLKQAARDPSDLTRANAVQDALRTLPQRLADDGVDVTRFSDELAAVTDNGVNITSATRNLSAAQAQSAVVNATDNVVGATDNLSASVDELVVKAGGDAAPQAIRELDELLKQAARDPSDLTRAQAVEDALRTLPQRLADDGVDVTRFSDELAGVADDGASFTSATRNLSTAQAQHAVVNATDNLSGSVDELLVKAGGDAAPQAIRELDELVKLAARDPSDLTRAQVVQDALRTLPQRLADDGVDVTRFSDELARVGDSGANFTGATRNLSAAQAQQAIRSASDNMVGATDNLSASVDELVAKAGGDAAPQAIRDLDELVKQAVRDPSDLTRARAVQDALRTLPQRLADDGIDATRFSDELASVSDNGARFGNATRNLSTAQAHRAVVNATDNVFSATDNLSGSVDELVAKAGGDAAPQAIRELDELVKQVARDPSDLTRAQAVQDALRRLPQRLADDGVDVTRFSDELAGVTDNGAILTRATGKLSAAQAQRAVVNATDNFVAATDDLTSSIDDLLVKAGDDAPQALRDLDELAKQAARDPSDLNRAQAVEDALRTLPQRLAEDGVDVSRFSDELARVSDNGVNFTNATRNLSTAQAQRSVVSATDNFMGAADNLSGSIDNLLVKTGDDAPQALRDLDELVKQAARDPSDLSRAQAVQDALRTLPQRLADDGVDVSRFSDELASISDNGANFTSASRNLRQATANQRLAVELAQETSDIARVLPTLTDDIAQRSSRIETTLDNIRTATTRPGVNGRRAIHSQVDEVAQYTRMVRNGADDAATIQKLNESVAELNRLAQRSGSRQLIDDVAKLGDDTRGLVRSLRESKAPTTIQRTRTNLATHSQQISNQVNRMRSGSQLPRTVQNHLDNIADNARMLGNSSDDLRLLRNIDESIEALAGSGRFQPAVLDNLRATMRAAQRDAVELASARQLSQATRTTVQHASTISNTAQRAARTIAREDAPFVRSQLDELSRTADNITSSANPGTEIQRMRTIVDELETVRPGITGNIRRSVNMLDESVAEASAVRRIAGQTQRLENGVNAIRNSLVADGTSPLMKAGTEPLVADTLLDLQASVGKITASNADEAQRALSAARQSIRTISDSGNTALADNLTALVDDTVDIAAVERLAVANKSVAAGIGEEAARLTSSSADEAAALARIQTAADDLASGAVNPQLVESINTDVALLSAGNKKALEPLVSALRMEEQAAAINRIAGRHLSLIREAGVHIGDDTATLSTKMGKAAEASESIDLLHSIGAIDNATAVQLRVTLAEAETAARLAGQNPMVLTFNPARLRALAATGDPAAVDGLLIEQLTSQGLRRSRGTFGQGLRVARSTPEIRSSMLRHAAVATIGYGLIGSQLLKAYHYRRYGFDVYERMREDGGKTATGSDTQIEAREGSTEQPAGEDARVAIPGVVAADIPDLSSVADAIIESYRGTRAPDSGLLATRGLNPDLPDAIFMEQRLQDTGRLFYQVGGFAPAAEAALNMLPLARSVFIRPTKPTGVQGELERIVNTAFNWRSIRNANIKPQKNMLATLTGNVQVDRSPLGQTYSQHATTGIVKTMRTMTARSSGLVAADLMGRENAEPGLDRTGGYSGPAQQTSSITAYSIPSGLAFAKQDPTQVASGSDDEDGEGDAKETLLSEAIKGDSATRTV